MDRKRFFSRFFLEHPAYVDDLHVQAVPVVEGGFQEGSYPDVLEERQVHISTKENTGLPTKNEYSETILRNLFSPVSCFLVSQNWLISVLNPLVNQNQNTELNAETKN